MRSIRNVAVFLGVLVLVIIVYPLALVAVGTAFVNGREFESYFGWLSWPHVIFAAVPFFVFFIGGALLSWLVASRRPIGWALLLGVAYGAIRAYFSSQSVTSARDAEEMLWLGVEVVLPVAAACLGAYLFRRYAPQRQNDTKPPNLSLNPDASPAALTRRPLGAG